jgi:hypothetical protein
MNTSKKIISWLYNLTLLMIAVSGFGQMPIFSRYYLAKIPGFRWLGEFYTTHIIHYIAAGVLIALAFYVITDLLMSGKGIGSVTITGLIKSIIITGLIISGGLMMFRNFPGVYMNHTFIIALDFIHLSLCMILLLFSLYTLTAKKKWVVH